MAVERSNANGWCRIRRGGQDLLTTQLYIQGHPGNEKDSIWRELKTRKDRDAVTVAFKAMQGTKAGEQEGVCSTNCST